MVKNVLDMLGRARARATFSRVEKASFSLLKETLGL
jgi:hypothetical protein